MDNEVSENARIESATINLLTDFGFKRIFGTEAYKKNLIRFLNAFLKEDIGTIRDVTGATPSQSGVQTYTWDFKDAAGKEVPAGNYKICFEATLYFNSILMYCGTFSTKDKAGEIALTSTLTEEDEQHKNMVTEVKAAIK